MRLTTITRLEKVRGAGTGAILAVMVLASACTGQPAGPLEQEHHAIERGEATRARVELNMSGGDLSVRSGATQLLEGDFSFNVPALKPAVAYAVDGSTGVLKVSQRPVSGSYENTWDLSLDEAMPIELHVTMGAGDATLVLGRLNLQSVAVTLGAGDLILDLRGMPAGSYPVSVNAGAGDTTIHLPATAGLSVRTVGVVGDTTASGLEKRDDRWVNARPPSSPVKLDVRVQHAIGDLKLLAE